MVLAIAGAVEPARAATELRAVQFAQSFDNTRIVIELGAEARFRVSKNGSSDRIEIVFDGARAAPRASAGAGFGLVRLFRAEKLRGGAIKMIFELSRPARVAAAFTLEAGFGQSAQAVIELAPGLAIVQAPIPKAPAPPSLPLLAGAGTASKAPAYVGSIAPPQPPTGSIADELAKRTIAIDAGHGGADPGADSVAGYREKEITLAAAQTLRQALEATGRYRVVMVRNSDVYLKLRERVTKARKARADLFVSLHADSKGGPLLPVAGGSTRGASVYTLSTTASDAESERYAQQENHADQIGDVDLRDQSSDVAGILVDLAMRETVSDGNRFAELVVDSLQQGGVTVLPRSPHRSAGFAVLKSPDIPSALIEMGYLSDIADAHDLAAPEYQSRLSSAILHAIDRYFAWVEASRG